MSREPASLARPEYAALAAEFGSLAAQFGQDIDADLRSDIARLAATIECIDRHIDDIACDASRGTLWASIVAILEKGQDGELGADLAAEAGSLRGRLAADLVEATLDIREVAVRRGVLARILRLVRKEIVTSEQLRNTRNRGAYVGRVLREGRLTAALALVIAGPACGAPFRRFFFRLGGPANIIDKLRDARADHARGEMLLHPGVLLHARLALAMAVRLPALFASHPRAWQVVHLGVRYLAGENTASATLGTLHV